MQLHDHGRCRRGATTSSESAKVMNLPVAVSKSGVSRAAVATVNNVEKANSSGHGVRNPQLWPVNRLWNHHRSR